MQITINISTEIHKFLIIDHDKDKVAYNYTVSM